MKKKATIILLFCLLLLVTAVAAYLRGRNDVWIGEFKIYQGNLISFDQQGYSPDLKEFIKGRYYFLANKIPRGWLGSPHDYGSVSTNVEHLGVGKGPTTPQEEYRKFKERLSR